MASGSPPSTGTQRTWIVAAWLVVFANGPLFFVARKFLDLPGTWEGPVLRPAIVVSIGAAVAMVALDRQRIGARPIRPAPVVPLAMAAAFGLWATLTTFWSLEPETTLWRGLGYTFLPFVAWVIADLDQASWRRALAAASGVIVATSVMTVVLRPEWGTDFNDDWRGVMTNRNALGPICALALFAGVAMVVAGARRRGGALAGLAAICMLGTGSRTAMLAFVIAFGVATVVVVARREHLERPRRGLLASATGALVVGGAVVAGALVRFWDEPTFAQRREIWDLVGDHIADAPLHGVGWASFWHHPQLHTDPLLQRGSAHGSIPELLLGGGVVALALWLAVTGYALVAVARTAWRRPDGETWLWLSVVVFLIVENLTESYVLWFSYNWIVLIAAALRFGPLRPTGAVTTPERIGERVVSGPARSAVGDRSS